MPNGAWVEYIPQLDSITTSRMTMRDGYAVPPEAPGLDAIIRGLGLVTPDDHELLRFTDRVYDGLYAWVQRLTQ